MEKSTRENEYIVRYRPADHSEEWCYFAAFFTSALIPGGKYKIKSFDDIEEAKILGYKEGQETVARIEALYGNAPGYHLLEIELKVIYEKEIPRFELMDMD